MPNALGAYVPTAQTVIAQGIALGMPAPNARLPRRGNIIDAFVRPVGAWRFRWDVCTQGVALGYHRLPRWGIARSRIAYWGIARSRIAYWGIARSRIAYWGIVRSCIAYWGIARSCIAYWGVVRRGFERWIVVRLVFACLFVVRWGIVQFVVRWGVGQGLFCIRLPRIGLDFCELGHCDWRIVVLAYVPTARTPIAQGNALGMPTPDDPLPRRGNMIDAIVRPVGAWRLGWDVRTQGVALGYHRLPRWGIAHRPRWGIVHRPRWGMARRPSGPLGHGEMRLAINPIHIFHRIQSRTFSIIFGTRPETIRDDGVLSGHQCIVPHHLDATG